MNFTDEVIELRKLKIEQIVRDFYHKGWAPATAGNYSFRHNHEDLFWVSRSGIDKSQFNKNDLMLVDINAKPMGESFFRPSAEILLHSAIYGSCGKEVAAILHTHSVYNTVLSYEINLQYEGKFSVLALNGFEVQKAFSGITSHEQELEFAIFPNSQDMNVLSKEIKEYLLDNPQTKCFLLAGHGMYAWGNSLDEAKRHVEAAEFLFECYWKLNYKN